MLALLPPARLRAYVGADVPVSGAQARALRRDAGLDVAGACAWLGCHRTTLARLEAGRARVPAAAVHLYAILAGVLPWQTWDGWFVDGAGALTSPDDRRVSYRPGELAAVTFAWQLAAEARRALRAAGVGEAAIARRLPRAPISAAAPASARPRACARARPDP